MMTAEDLKFSILQLAMSGKLVEQRTEEGTGEALYKRMQADKARLIREHRIKKDKPLAEVTIEELPFEVPQNWKAVRVGEIGSWSAGATPSRSHPEYYGGDIPWLKTGDLNDGDIYEVPEFITEEGVQHSSVRLNPVGSVLMAMYGATIGKLGILQIEATTNQACCACICYEGMWNKYLFYYLLSQRKNYIAMGAGGAQPNISKDKIVNSIIALPPLAEQKRIVAKIEELMPFVEQYAVASTKLNTLNTTFPEMMKKSILQEAVQGKLVPQDPNDEPASLLLKKIAEEKKRLIKEGNIKKQKPLPEITEDEIPFDIPESWEWVRVNDVLVLENGDRSSKYPKETDYVEEGIPFFGARDMVNGKMDFSSVRFISKDKYDELGGGKLKDGDLVCLLRGSVGKIACFYENEHYSTGFICAQMVIMRLIIKDLLSYIQIMTETPYYQKIISSKVTGTAVRQLPALEISKVVIPIPPLQEQKRIVSKIHELMLNVIELTEINE